jgi:hypothetical protein
MIRSQGVNRLGRVALGVALSFLISGVARAQDQAVVDKIVAMNKKALDDYDTLEWDSAKRTLLEALVAGKKAGLDNHPVMARTYVHLGCVYITGLKDRQKGLQSFARAIEIDPTIKIERAMSDDELEQAFAEAAKQARPRAGGGAPVAAAPPPAAARPPSKPVEEHAAAPPPAPGPPPKRKGPIMQAEAPPPSLTYQETMGESGEEPDLPAHITALDCPTPDDVPPDKAVKLRCAAAGNLGLAKVVLMYRVPGSEEWGTVDMERTPKGWYQGKLPKKAVTGKSVQLYFEGRNAAGKPVVSNGRADSPNLILIREEAAAAAAEEETGVNKQAIDREENPLAQSDEPTGPRLYLGKVDKSKIGLDTRYGNRRWWIGLGIGSGYGYAKGDGLETRPDLQQYYKAGLGWAGLGHLAPEVGYQVTPDIAVSIQGRNQWIPQSGPYAKFTASGAQSVLARGLFFSKQSRLRFYGSMMVGGGEGFRFVLYPDQMRTDYKDTVRGGPYLGGVGGGLYYEMTHATSFVTELNALAGFPIFSTVVDINVAFQVNLY